MAHPPLVDDLVRTPEELRDAATRALWGAGADADIAVEVARSLVESDLRGVSSHGVLRVGEYVAQVRRGVLEPAARPRLVSRTPTVVVDGRKGFGQLGARLLVEETTARARAAGVALGTLAGVRHVGRLGEWAELAANEGRDLLDPREQLGLDWTKFREIDGRICRNAHTAGHDCAGRRWRGGELSRVR